MQDEEIVSLYFAREERAIAETKTKYGRYCYSIAYTILKNREDAEECENDTYLGAWNAIPPHRPSVLSSFLGKITRRIAIKRLESEHAEKRGGGTYPIALSELGDMAEDLPTADEETENERISEVIDAFLRTLPREEREIFVLRYWYFDSVKEIAAYFDCGESRVKMTLLRTREKLRKRLQEEEISL